MGVYVSPLLTLSDQLGMMLETVRRGFTLNSKPQVSFCLFHSSYRLSSAGNSPSHSPGPPDAALLAMIPPLSRYPGDSRFHVKLFSIRIKALSKRRLSVKDTRFSTFQAAKVL